MNKSTIHGNIFSRISTSLVFAIYLVSDYEGSPLGYNLVAYIDTPSSFLKKCGAINMVLQSEKRLKTLLISFICYKSCSV